MRWRDYPPRMPTIKRKLTFVAWADAIQKRPFDLAKASTGLAKIKPNGQVLANGDDVPEAMTFHPVMGVGEVLELALEPERAALEAR